MAVYKTHKARFEDANFEKHHKYTLLQMQFYSAMNISYRILTKVAVKDLFT